MHTIKELLPFCGLLEGPLYDLAWCATMQAILSHPLALVKLGMFLRDVAAMRQTKKRKPIVLVGPADAHGNCLVVAVTCEPMSAEAVQVCTRPAPFPLFPLQWFACAL